MSCQPLSEALMSVELCLPVSAEPLARKFTPLLKNSPAMTVYRWLSLHRCCAPAAGLLTGMSSSSCAASTDVSRLAAAVLV